MNVAYIICLGFSALVVSVTGAYFSVSGLMKLFSGAPMAVLVMGTALELAKMVSASFLHRNWTSMHFIMKFYMSAAVGILMLITSMGIFGYLSFAFQSTSAELKNTMTRIEYIESEGKKVQSELDRLQKTIDEVPENRVSRRLDLQKELEPRFQALQRQSIEVQMKMRTESLKKLSYQMEIGPIIFVAEMFGANTDKVATWLIILFVIVFDPLAVCLVLATSFAIKQRERGQAAAPLTVKTAA
jgi:preprotein translocase subunit SecF